MDVQTELLEALSRLFAHDLNTMMAVPQAPHRLVLFFDTHEAFWACGSLRAPVTGFSSVMSGSVNF